MIMCPLAAEPLADIKSDCSKEEAFMTLQYILFGYSPPGNVLPENPYCYRPENLPNGFWYLTHSGHNRATENGFWQPKGDPVRVSIDSSICGLITTLKFCDLQALEEDLTTDWIMQEYKIIWNVSNCETREKGVNSLCRVFQEDVHPIDQKMAQTFDVSDISRGNNNLSTASLTVTSRSNAENGSTSNHQVVAADILQNHHPMEDLHGNVDASDDFLELRDLESPQSPSSNSDNSSCLTMSSDECFDSLALLQDIEAEQLQDVHAKFTVSTVKPSNVVTHEVTLGSFTSHEREENPKTDSSQPNTASAVASKAVGRRNPKHVVGDGESQSGCKNIASRASTSENTSALERTKRKSDKKNKMFKKLCFIPFQFLC
ncbi:hypothetical protein BT93_L3576 [Corymbia citriodora subsp. variegata]|uniref:NAC domain-containing protein n=1 Tax=Corymbia citriodora subsp. variegata TaxID=360336 RepID=A0A8T0CVD2_CORYI|nr:hypothetical protein BT93_L3576 [Corymbia citriodora subsp. variegata]KAF7851578.1 hypothetical protein BT93_L3576 [Corymbia citriodora subsp. variegata]